MDFSNNKYIKYLVKHRIYGVIIFIIFIFSSSVNIFIPEIAKESLYNKYVNRSQQDENTFNTTKLEVDGEEVTIIEKVKSAHFDHIRIETISHDVGVKAEYIWINENNPNMKVKMQLLVKNISARKLISSYFPEYFSKNNTDNRNENFDVIELEKNKVQNKYVFVEIPFLENGVKPTNFRN